MIITNENKCNFQSESENIFNELGVILQPHVFCFYLDRGLGLQPSTFSFTTAGHWYVPVAVCVKGTLRGCFFQSTAQQATFPCTISAVR